MNSKPSALISFTVSFAMFAVTRLLTQNCSCFSLPLNYVKSSKNARWLQLFNILTFSVLGTNRKSSVPVKSDHAYSKGQIQLFRKPILPITHAILDFCGKHLCVKMSLVLFRAAARIFLLTNLLVFRICATDLSAALSHCVAHT